MVATSLQLHIYAGKLCEHARRGSPRGEVSRTARVAKIESVIRLLDGSSARLSKHTTGSQDLRGSASGCDSTELRRAHLACQKLGRKDADGGEHGKAAIPC